MYYVFITADSVQFLALLLNSFLQDYGILGKLRLQWQRYWHT